ERPTDYNTVELSLFHSTSVRIPAHLPEGSSLPACGGAHAGKDDPSGSTELWRECRGDAGVLRTVRTVPNRTTLDTTRTRRPADDHGRRHEQLALNAVVRTRPLGDADAATQGHHPSDRPVREALPQARRHPPDAAGRRRGRGRRHPAALPGDHQ